MVAKKTSAKGAAVGIKARPVSSMVKKDLASIRAQAASLKAFLKDPGVAAIRVCECCIQVS
jgi:hypothetical protein